MWCQLESASADPTRVSGEEIAPLDAKGWASVLPFQSLAKVGPRGEGAAWPPWQLPFNLAQVSIDRGSWEILEASTLPAGFPSGSDGKKKNLPAMQGPRRSLGWEDALEKGMATHSSILAWRISWTEELLGYSPEGRRVGHN